MPVLRVSMIEGRDNEQKAKAAAALTVALEAHLGCRPEDVTIIFEEEPRENWAIAGKLLSEKRPAPERP
ncbi:tautomerase family protein [Microvirga alba]|uniref:Tautomerase family protein n=1 Tax=Microvirga alba TaxID=2791025 RepID=A0A931BUG9_9HYPH|nr:tautomerase family protein [Microvirga alba]MBF9235365.1 tautomerase family protein [Microvirga alba]